MISGSRIDRFVRCAASDVLPKVEADRDPEPAERGTAIHRYLDRAPAIGKAEALAEVPERFRLICDSIDLDDLPGGLATEVAFAYDWRDRTGRELGRSIGRKYIEAGLNPEREIPLTMDLIGVDESRAFVLVRDFKTGFTKLPRPGSYGQTLLGGLAAASAYGCSSARLELTYVDTDGDLWTVRDDVDAWDLLTYGDMIEAAIESADAMRAGGPVSVAEGPHCDHCEAFKSCPAKTALVRLLPTMGASVERPGYLAPDRLVATYRQIQIWKEILGRVEGEILGLAAFEPLDLGDGTVLGPVTTEREKYQGDVAAAVLTEWYGAAAAKEASIIQISKERLREAVASRRKPGEKLQTKAGDGVLDRVDKEIRARNGIDWSRTTNVRVHRPRAKRLPGA